MITINKSHVRIRIDVSLIQGNPRLSSQSRCTKTKRWTPVLSRGSLLALSPNPWNTLRGITGHNYVGLNPRKGTELSNHRQSVRILSYRNFNRTLTLLPQSTIISEIVWTAGVRQTGTSLTYNLCSPRTMSAISVVKRLIKIQLKPAEFSSPSLHSPTALVSLEPTDVTAPSSFFILRGLLGDFVGLCRKPPIGWSCILPATFERLNTRVRTYESFINFGQRNQSTGAPHVYLSNLCILVFQSFPIFRGEFVWQ